MSHPVDPGSVPSDRQQAQREQADSDHAGRPTGKQPAHAGVGHLGENILVFTIMFVLFLVGLWAISFSDGENVWPFAVCIGLAFIAFFIPQGVIGRSDTGADLAAGNRTKAKKRSAAVDS
ncbi:hypothetical protein I6N91_09105 [Arthrobacter sp. MSA 4-2]|uniref:hypothetical protein n=1 Tax=Arthrobacter sp. MSA 4-2 TaxID=2794349 RepID=UPI0018E70417|nr:hypothetical protein [Arthrobacter sp. MSA 4-2]MBJ2121135.1 hypothetical protein [Arthrobacter sp. MSA 4-2]